MERRGPVGRRRHEADNRGSEVFITEECRAVFLAAAGHSWTVRTRFPDVLTWPRLEALADAMHALARHLTSLGDRTRTGQDRLLRLRPVHSKQGAA